VSFAMSSPPLVLQTVRQGHRKITAGKTEAPHSRGTTKF
jgi:hypothetical protein